MSDFLIALVELLEAEARAAKKHLLRGAAGIGLLAATVTLFLAGIALLVAAAYLVLTNAVPPSAALAICGAAVLLVGGATAWLARRASR